VPLYEYQCGACGHRFDHIQTYSDPILRKCPKCKKLKLKKLLSAPAVQFKGTGWYVTDYGRKSSSTSHSESDHGREKDRDKDKDKVKDKAGKPSAAAADKPATGKKKD
jgi:putative FmdB family regulatory protein